MSSNVTPAFIAVATTSTPVRSFTSPIRTPSIAHPSPKVVTTIPVRPSTLLCTSTASVISWIGLGPCYSTITHNRQFTLRLATSRRQSRESRGSEARSQYSVFA